MKKIKRFFLFTGLTSACIYGINQFMEVTANIKNLLSGQEGSFFKWRYGNIFYTKHGKGSPILFIHDLHPASSSIEWSLLLKRLKKDHTVYTIDLLGCGRSDKPNLTYTNYMYVQIVTDFIKQIIGEKTDLAATGNSCSFSLMAAHMNPAMINRLIFINPVSLSAMQANPSRFGNTKKRILECPVFGIFIYNLLMSERMISHLFETEYYKKKSFISEKIKDCYYEAAHAEHSGGRFLLGSIIGNYTNIHIIPALRKIKNPIYLIGNRESESSRMILDSYQKQNKTIETASISNCGWLPQLEEPDKVDQIFHMFLEDDFS